MGKTLIFLSPLGSLKFFDFLSFLFILKLSCSKPFHNTLYYASTANIEEVMKFYNLGDKTFETDFSSLFKIESSCSDAFVASVNHSIVLGRIKGVS